MPWHVANSPCIDYKKRVVRVDNEIIPVERMITEHGEKLKITNIGVKKFRKLLRKGPSEQVQVFQVVIREKSDDLSKVKMGKKDSRIDDLLKEYKVVFKSELPPGLPPKRSVEHTIEIEDGSKPPHRPLYQLSPAELEAAKEYVEDLLKKGKIRRSKSPYGAPLFFVKEHD